ncbi:MAG: hypothetical protein ACAH83_01665 [Alphaproteobacteria bacterium]
MKANTALKLGSAPLHHPFTPRVRMRIVRDNRRDSGVTETDIFALLTVKEEECCDRATD